MNALETAMAAALQKAYEAGRRDAAVEAQVETSPVPHFQLNDMGDPEFASVTLTLDHLMMPTADGHINQKFILSTQDPEQALFGLFRYYGESDRLLQLPSTLDQLSRSKMNPGSGIFIYVVPGELATDRQGGLIVQAVMSTKAWSRMVHHKDYGNGSELVLVGKLTEAFTNILDAVKVEKKAYPPLTFLLLEEDLKLDSALERDDAAKAAE